jgi:hypothetical protein
LSDGCCSLLAAAPALVVGFTMLSVAGRGFPPGSISFFRR